MVYVTIMFYSLGHKSEVSAGGTRTKAEIPSKLHIIVQTALEPRQT